MGTGPQTVLRRSDRAPERGDVGYMYEEVEAAGPLRRQAGEMVPYGETIRVATFNVQSLWKPLAQGQLVEYTKDRDIP